MNQNLKFIEKEPKRIVEDLGNGINLEMVYIPAGEFMMGTNDEEIDRLCKKQSWDGFKREAPQHQVKLKEFYVGKYQITQTQYQAIMGVNLSYFKGANNPVERVSWNMAQEFCQKLSAKTGKTYRLPSESQWEYACRAGSNGKLCFGDDESQLEDYAWYGDLGGETHPVGQKKPNVWGLYDMHGNVWEWCQDDFVDNYKNTPRDGNVHKNSSMYYVVLRGGAWNSNLYECRSAYRYFFEPQACIFKIIGFRVVCEMEKTLSL